MKPTFNIPNSSMVVVVWYRDGIRHEQLIPTPKSNNDLFNTMLMDYRVGFSEIRAIKAVVADELINVNPFRHRGSVNRNNVFANFVTA